MPGYQAYLCFLRRVSDKLQAGCCALLLWLIDKLNTHDLVLPHCRQHKHVQAGIEAKVTKECSLEVPELLRNWLQLTAVWHFWCGWAVAVMTSTPLTHQKSRTAVLDAANNCQRTQLCDLAYQLRRLYYNAQQRGLRPTAGVTVLSTNGNTVVRLVLVRLDRGALPTLPAAHLCRTECRHA